MLVAPYCWPREFKPEGLLVLLEAALETGLVGRDTADYMPKCWMISTRPTTYDALPVRAV
jgi:hypothetical protein